MELPKRVKEIFREEWFRAKRIIGLKCRKPHLYSLSSRTRRTWGYHRGNHHTIAHNIYGKWIRNPHTIGLSPRIFNEENQLRSTIRHEICHCVHQNHSSKFKSLLGFLEKKIEKETTPEKE